jgi:hypothetical protein
MSHTPYYYAPGGKYVLFLDLLGFTAFVRSSFQKKAEETDDREKEFELAQKQFKIAQAAVDREYRRFHEHLEELLRRPARRGKSRPRTSVCPLSSAPARSTAAARGTTSSNASTKRARAQRRRTAASSRRC